MNLQYYKGVDEIPSLEKVNVLTGFKPSTQKGVTSGSNFTLGHLVQIQKVLELEKRFQGEGKKVNTNVIIADVQGFQNNPTKDHLENMREYTRLYCLNALSCFSELNDAIIFRESKVFHDVVQPLSHFISNNLDFDEIPVEYHHKGNDKMLDKYGKKMTDGMLAGMYVGQAAHGLGADANVIPAGKNQMYAFELHKKAILKHIENGFEFPFEKEVLGIEGGGYLLGIDGNRMQTSKGNTIEVTTPLNEVRGLVNAAHESFLESVANNFGDAEEYGKLIGVNAKRDYIMGILETKLAPIQEKYHNLLSENDGIEQSMIDGENRYKTNAKGIIEAVNHY